MLIGIIGLLAVPLSSLLVPMNSGSGDFPIEVSGVSVTGIDCDSDRVVVVYFSAEGAALEFFLVHSDYFDQGELPSVASCEYHVIAQSATYQFTTDDHGIWYLIFTNSPRAQIVSWGFTEYPPEEWLIIQFNTLFLAISCIGVAIFVINRFARKRLAEKSDGFFINE